MKVAVSVVLLAGIVLANLPWLTTRFLAVFPLKRPKSLPICLLEWLVYYFLAGAVALGTERKMTGGLYAQGWEFYVVTFFLFMVFALPGFIFRLEFRPLPPPVAAPPSAAPPAPPDRPPAANPASARDPGRTAE